jgi:hypothetical protein
MNLKGISRVDSPERNEHCWLVRATKDSTTYTKSFADGKYGGKDDALKTAAAFRDKLYKALDIDPNQPRKRGFSVFPYAFFTKKANNKTGVVGVYRATRKLKRKSSGGKVGVESRDPYVASINIEKYKQVQKFFSINELGEKKAKQMAIAWRKEMEQKVAERNIGAHAPKGPKYASADEVVQAFEAKAAEEKAAKKGKKK